MIDVDPHDGTAEEGFNAGSGNFTAVKYSAISEGETKIDSIAVACIDAESDSAIFPCGLSRQRLSEFNTDYVIVVHKNTLKKYTFDEILPFDFKF